jgi:hypothetical protein
MFVRCLCHCKQQKTGLPALLLSSESLKITDKVGQISRDTADHNNRSYIFTRPTGSQRYRYYSLSNGLRCCWQQNGLYHF